MIVRWTSNAENHLDALHAYIAHDPPDTAEQLVDRLTSRSTQIAEFPYSGRKVPEYDLDQVREVIEGPYRLIYLIKPDRIEVLAVIHGAMEI